VGIAVSINGKIVPPANATISVFDRGFLYGDSVFETIRTYAGKPFALQKHLERLERSAALVFIELPVPQAVLVREVDELVAAAGNDESYVRVMVSRGQGELGLDPALAGVSNRVMVAAPLQSPSQAVYDSGVKVVTFRTQRATDAMREAKKVGAVEALIVDAKGRIIEGATSNVFWVQDGSLFTPPVEVGILAGITRAYVLEVAKALELPVRQVAPKQRELLKADEVFISSSIRELLPVVEVDGKTIGTGKPGPITQRLHAEFRRFVRAEPT
jgi:branched-chain amino acid aminotransferase